MKKDELRRALGTTPPAFAREVNQMIDRLEDKKMKKRYKLTAILAAALIASALGATAVAAYQGTLARQFTNTESKMTNEAAIAGIREMHETYEGSAVRCAVQEALYDAEGGTYALGWTLENLTGEGGLYVVLDGVTFNGELGWERSGELASNFFLPPEGAQSSVLGEIPEGGGNVCELSLSVLRAVGPYTQEGDGYIIPPEQGESHSMEWWIEGHDGDVNPGDDADIWNAPYSDYLAGSASFEIADRFTLNLTLDERALAGTVKHLVSESDYVFDDCEIRIGEAEVTPTSVKIHVDYITPEPPVDGGKGIGPSYDFDFTLPGSDIWWCGNSGGSFSEEPVRLEDGRWLSTYDFNAVELFTQPDTLVLHLSTYPVDEDGELDLAHPIPHEENDILLRFE